jgi:hypothetical protein
MAEKTLNEIAREARSLYQKASEAAQRENFDYASTLFCQILEREPAFYEGRKALRAVQAKKAGAGGGGFFKKMLSGAGSSPLVAKAQIALHSNPANALAIAEQILNADPNSSAGHKIIVEASKALELPKVAVMSLEVLVRNSPRDKQLAIDYANTIAEAGGDSSAGERVLQELIRTSPYDPDLVQALKNLSAHKTLDEGGYNALEGGEGSFRSVLRNKGEAVSLEQENRVQKSEDVVERLINEYETRWCVSWRNFTPRRRNSTRRWNIMSGLNNRRWVPIPRWIRPLPILSSADTIFNWNSLIRWLPIMPRRRM